MAFGILSSCCASRFSVARTESREPLLAETEAQPEPLSHRFELKKAAFLCEEFPHLARCLRCEGLLPFLCGPEARPHLDTLLRCAESAEGPSEELCKAIEALIPFSEEAQKEALVRIGQLDRLVTLELKHVAARAPQQKSGALARLASCLKGVLGKKKGPEDRCRKLLEALLPFMSNELAYELLELERARTKAIEASKAPALAFLQQVEAGLKVETREEVRADLKRQKQEINSFFCADVYKIASAEELERFC